MLDKALDQLAERILGFDEASLTVLYDKYKTRMEQFDTSRDWEKAVIIFFIINSVRVKNKIFNDNIEKLNDRPMPAPSPAKRKPNLKLVK